jgi:hypothetical protein
VQVHLSTPEVRKIIFDLRQREVRVSLLRLELDEHVDVAVRPEVVAEHGTEQGQPLAMTLPAEVGNAIPRNLDAGTVHGVGMVLRLSIPGSSMILTALDSRSADRTRHGSSAGSGSPTNDS